MNDPRFLGWAYGTSHTPPLTYVPTRQDDPEPAYAVADAWTPPHPLGLPAGLCVRARRAAATVAPEETGVATYFYADLDPDLEAEVLDRYRQANSLWWRLDIDRWAVRLKRYRPGDRHVAHTDLYAGSATRKLAGTVQLSRPSEYDGGALVVHNWGERLRMPTDLGTLVAFPAWATHEVEPVTRGERWVLLVNGYGPPLR